MKKYNYSSRKEKLIRYSAITGAMAGVTAAGAQITYTDVIPDAVISTGNQYNLDLNNDLTPDIILGAQAISGSQSGFSYSGLGVGLQTPGTAEGVIAHAASSAPVNYADALNFGTMIDNTGNFMSAPSSSSTNILIMAAKGTIAGTFPFSIGSWLGVTDKYLGIKFMIGANTHYGWARLDCAADASSFTVKDYAYNTVVSQGIGAGSTTVGVEETNISQWVDLHLANGQLAVNVFNDQLSSGNITITDITGQVVFNETVNGSQNKFSTENLSAGIYVITVKFAEGQMTEKMFIR